MAEQSNNIRVPERRDDEPAASAAQLQAIRRLVTGMSLRGFRFDYRKLGVEQADAVITQLERLRAAQGTTMPNKRGGGCVATAVRGAVTLFVVLIVLAGVGAGGYLIYERVNDASDQAGTGASDDAAEQDESEANDGGLRDSEMFPGLGVRDTPSPPHDDPEQQSPRPVEADPSPQEPPTPTPRDIEAQRRLGESLDALEDLLVRLSQFTRSDYAQPVRAQSSAGMLARLDELSLAMDAIGERDAALARRVRAVVSRYADEAVDGAAMRDEIDAIRMRLDKLRADF